MVFSRWSGTIGAAVMFLVAVALLCPVSAGAAAVYGNYFTFEADNQLLHIRRNESVLPTSASGSPMLVTVYYDWDFDGTWVGNWGHADDVTPFPGDYDRAISVNNAAGGHEFFYPLDPQYQVYYVSARSSGSLDTYYTQGVVVNNRAEVVLANDEPTPVRLQEIGLASEASTLAPDLLPTSLEASVSVDGTLPVSVASILGEDTGDVFWAVLGGLSGIGSFLAIDRLAAGRV